MADLEEDFERLGADVRALLALLTEAEEVFWSRMLARGLRQIDSRELAGATYVLGCYGGANTFSDLVIGEQWIQSEPLRHRNLNARLGHLRTQVFESANAITARRNW